MARSKSDRSKRLEAVKKKLASTNYGGSGGYWKPKQGRNVIRILPGVGEMEDFFWQDVGRHYLPNISKSFTCLSFTIGEECPICEFVDGLYKAGDEESKKLAGEMRVRRQFWMNIINRADTEEDASPLIFTPGPMIFKQVASLIQDPDYGDAVFDPDEGLDLIITRTGEMLNTEYDVKARRNESPLSEDPDLIDKWLEEAKDLSVVELTDDVSEDAELLGDDVVVTVLPYDRLKEEFEALDASPEDEDDLPPFDDDEEELEKVIRRKRGGTRRSSRRRRG